MLALLTLQRQWSHVVPRFAREQLRSLLLLLLLPARIRMLTLLLFIAVDDAALSCFTEGAACTDI